VLVYLHGQYGQAGTVARELQFHKSTYNSLIEVYPQGLDDSSESDCGTGWNVLDSAASHDSDSCSEAAFESTCCYKSCLAAGVCQGDGSAASCGWATCIDDDDFVLSVIADLQQQLCVGDIWLAGGSNGAMMAHGLYSSHPELFKNVMPVYGLPLKSHLSVPDGVKATSILAMHDRSDSVIPWAGGEAGGWFYESGKTVMDAWAKVHECELASSTPVVTPYDGGNDNLACEWYGACKSDGTSDGTVMFCLYDGQHGSWPLGGNDLALWFFEGKWRFL
jgi:poly(3-hydroxybutyrate) depolymerase